jgi:hypothetical protein
MRRSTSLLFIVAVIAVAIWLSQPAPPSPAVAPAPPAGNALVPMPAVPPPATTAVAAKAPDSNRSTLLDDLNQPAGTIQADLRLLHEVFAAWQTNFPREGNPVGENAEITRALAGANALKLALVPPDHPALNAAGELTDRWGTPFRFHQLSGTRMELRSAGPDRRFGTGDDAEFAP